MKALIIVFSQTGNTRRIAERIYDGITRVTGHCDIKPLSDAGVALLPEYDLVGLGSPVFYYKEPFNVRDFLEALPALNGQHWFVFCTHGNVIGNFFPSVTERLKEKGAKVIGCHNSYASITVPFYPRPSYTSGHPDRHDLEKARAFGTEVANRSSEIVTRQSDPANVPYPVSSKEWIQDSTRLTREILEQVLPKLSINMDTCIGCRECEQNCPVQGIDVEAAPPRIQTPCIYCWRCVNVCPTLSIGAEWESLVRMAPTNYARYRKELDKAAARGEFRWLVDPKIIDFNDPLFKQRERLVKATRATNVTPGENS
jgi:flavodoxin/NAD-dependent dihydropyrimidine dehydrogenase PreA subunit